MDIKTAVNIINRLPSNISVLFRGDHGIGKSEVVAQIAQQLGLRLLDRRMSQTSEGDTVGLPKQTIIKGADGKAYDVTQFCPPEFVVKAKMEPCLVFLDELNRATPEVMQACFQYALDRCDFQGDKFHPETRVFAAVNMSGNYQVNEMDPALLDRFFVIDLKPSAEDFFEHAASRPEEKGGPIHKDLLQFLKERPSRLDPAGKDPGNVDVSRRSWVRLDGTYRSSGVYDLDLNQNVGDKGLAYNLAIGFVGIEAATDLVDFLSRRETRFNADHVVGAYDKHRAKIKDLGQDKINTLIDLVCEHGKTNLWTNKQAKNIGKFVEDCPAELRVSFLVNFTRALKGNDNYIPNFKAIHPHVAPHVVRTYNPEATFGDEGDKPTKK